MIKDDHYFQIIRQVGKNYEITANCRATRMTSATSKNAHEYHSK